MGSFLGRSGVADVFRFWSALGVGILLTFGLASAKSGDFATQFRNSGIAAERAEALAKAVDAAMDKEAIVSLVPFFEDRSPVVAFTAASLAVMIDEPEAVKAIRKHIGNQDSASALWMALCFSYERSTVQLLIDRLRAGVSKQNEIAILFSLQVLTQQEYSSAPEWLKWWDASGHALVPPSTDDMEIQNKRMLLAASRLKIDLLRNGLASLKAKGANRSDPLAGISKLLDGMARTIEEGQKVKLSGDAERGDAAFAGGEYAAAVNFYHASIEANTNDLHSRYLLGCVLLETGKFADAAREFSGVESIDSKVTSAAFLRAVAQRRASQPGEPMLHAGLAVFSSWHPKPEIGAAGWDDPIMEKIIGQAMGGEGLYATSTKLEGLRDAGISDPKTGVGLSFLLPNPEQAAILEQTLLKFPETPLVLAAALASSIRKKEERQLELLQRLEKADPNNAFLGGLKVQIENPLSPDQRRDPAKRALNAAAIDQFRAAMNRKNFNSYSLAFAQSKFHVLDKIGDPFRLGGLATLDLWSPFYDVLPRVGMAVQPLIDRGDLAAAEKVADLLRAVNRRIAEGKCPLIALIMSNSTLSIVETALSKYYEKNGQSAKAAALQAEKESRKKEVAVFKNLEWVALIGLPVPSLQSALVSGMVEDEPGLARSYIEFLPKSPAK